MGKRKRRADKLKTNRADRARKMRTASKHTSGAQHMDHEQTEPGLVPANQGQDSIEQENLTESTAEVTGTEAVADGQIVAEAEVGEPQDVVEASEPINEAPISEPDSL